MSKHMKDQEAFIKAIVKEGARGKKLRAVLKESKEILESR